MSIKSVNSYIYNMEIQGLKKNLISILNSMKSAVENNVADQKTTIGILTELDIIINEINKDNPDPETVSTSVSQIEEFIRDFDQNILPYYESGARPYSTIRDLKTSIANNMPELLY